MKIYTVKFTDKKHTKREPFTITVTAENAIDAEKKIYAKLVEITNEPCNYHWTICKA